MRVACLSQDPGIGPNRRKGAAVHLLEMRRALEELGAVVHPLDERHGDAVLALLDELHLREPLDLLYERYALRRTAGADFASRAGIPFVLEVNAPLAVEEQRWRGGGPAHDLRRIEEHVFRRATRVIAVSTAVARYAIDRGAHPDAVRVFPNGVDTRRFEPRSPDDPLRSELVPDGRFALGFHGRLRAWHGLELLGRACARLLRRGAPVHLVLVGKGAFERTLGGYVPRERMTRVDWVPHEDVGRHVATFDALPLTHGPDARFYFSPLKLPEAMACGVVPIVPSMGDLPRIVTHGVDGIVVPPGDARALADSIESLILDPERRRALVRGAEATARRYSWRSIAAFALGRRSAPTGAAR